MLDTSSMMNTAKLSSTTHNQTTEDDDDDTNQLDGIKAIRGYINRIVSGDDKCRGMKVLLLDASTTQIVSSVYSQTEILSKEIYLVSRLDDTKFNPNLTESNNGNGTPLTHPPPQSEIDIKKNTSHLKAVVYIRPTEINCGLLVKELSMKKTRFSEYHIFFSGILPTSLLKLLSENDTKEKIKQIKEFYGDYIPINEDCLTLQCRHTIPMTIAAGTSWASNHAYLYERNLRGIQSILLSLKRQPNLGIRYSSYSKITKELAHDIHNNIISDQIFHFRNINKKRINYDHLLSDNTNQGQGGGTLLLILDRKDDPVTPLLSQWTYQAMVHELLGLNNSRVILKGAPNISKELEEVVLSSTEDEFFYNNRYKNFGELGESIQNMLKEYQNTTSKHNPNSLKTIEDMQNFMDKFPELRSKSHNVSKHVAIMGELARLVDVCSLMDVSQFEQELAVNIGSSGSGDQTSHTRELLEKLNSMSIKIPDKLRLGLLYALRYETSGSSGNNIHNIKSAMSKGGVPPDMIDLLDVMIKYAGYKQRSPGLYGEHTNLMTKMTKSFITSVQGISNVYSQHIPLLIDTIQLIIKGKLKNDIYPYVNGSISSNDVKSSRPGDNLVDMLIPNEIIVFIVGGITYEEATKINEFNIQHKGKYHIILSGSTIHNSTSFLEELKTL